MGRRSIAAALVVALSVPLVATATSAAAPFAVAITEGAGPHPPGTKVEVRLTGGAPGQAIDLRQCSDEGWPCGPSMYVALDAAGSASAAFLVRRHIGDEYGRVDCAVDPCAVYAEPFDGAVEPASTPLSVDPDAPLPRASLTITTPAPLPGRATVSVRGSGFVPGTFVSLRQCVWTATVRCAPNDVGYGEVGPLGAFTSTAQVNRVIDGVDCADRPSRCQIWADPLYGDIDRIAIAGLRFDPTLPLPVAPSVAVRPATGLTDRQVVEIEISSIVGTSFVTVALCGPEGECGAYVSAEAEPPSTTIEMALPRVLSEGVDCLVVACEIRAWIYDDGWQYEIVVPIEFDPDAPLGGPPTIRAVPGAGLWDGQPIEVRGSGFVPGQYLTMHQCTGPSPRPGGPVDLASCRELSGEAEVSGRGQMSLRTLVARFIGAGADKQDCAAVACHLAILNPFRDPPTLLSAVGLSFDTDGPVDDGGLPPLPEQLECVAWPTAGWPAGPIPPGVDAEAVAAVGERIVGPDASDSVVVIHGGRLVYERYADGITADTILSSFSMSKSFTSTMVGLLVDDGDLALDAPAPVAEWSTPGDARADITLRHLLNMSSGLEWYESYGDPQSDVLKMIQSADQSGYAIARPAEVEPGTRFQYSTGDTTILARIIATTAGVSGDSYRRFLHQELFDPLGIDPVEPGFDGAGIWGGGWVTNTTTRNFAKLGLLYIRHGAWEDQQLLSQSWVDFVRSPSPASDGYGGQFWLNGDGSFSMIGYAGQEVRIVPHLDLIVAVNNGYGAQEMVNAFKGAAPATCGTAPAGVDDEAELSAGATVDIDVLANDEGGEAGFAASTLTVSEAPAHGSATVVDGQVRYESSVGFHGPDELRYVVCTSDRRYCPEATVRITVDPIDLSLTWPKPGATTQWWPGLALPVALQGADASTITGVAATAVDCASGDAIGPVEPIAAHVHELPGARLWFWWPTDRSWQGCHELVVSVVDGVDRSAQVRWLSRPFG